MKVTNASSRRSAVELGGDALCLSFVSTIGKRTTASQEGLETYEHLVEWAVQTSVLTADQGRALRTEARRRPADASTALSIARELREALRAILAACARGRAVPPEAVAMLNAALPPALARLELRAVEGRFEWSWTLAGDELDAMLAPVIESAAELLTSVEHARIGECESTTCGRLFLDRSRNRSRRWCDMTVCGNRAKARRHYRRSKAASAG